jgi:type I restriction enzyme S subunit
MKPEYKFKSKSVNIIHTTYYTVPEDWQVFSLNNFAQEVKERFSTDKEGPILSVTKYKGFVESSKYFKKRIYSKDIKNYKLVENGDFAYATIHLDEGSLGLLKEFKRGYISPMYTVFRTNSSIDKDFLYYLLKSNMYIQIYKSLGEGSINRRKSISFDDLSKLKIPIPSLVEQQKIASILSKLDELVQKNEQIIEQTQILKKGLMQRLLIKGIRHTKFKNTELGKTPEDWVVIKLGEHVELRSGKSNPTKNLSESNQIPVYGSNGITGFFTEHIMERPTVVVGRVGEYAGSIHVTKGKSWITDNAIYFSKLPTFIDVNFLGSFLIVHDLGRFAEKTGQQN